MKGIPGGASASALSQPWYTCAESQGRPDPPEPPQPSHTCSSLTLGGGPLSLSTQHLSPSHRLPTGQQTKTWSSRSSLCPAQQPACSSTWVGWPSSLPCYKAPSWNWVSVTHPQGLCTGCLCCLEHPAHFSALSLWPTFRSSVGLPSGRLLALISAWATPSVTLSPCMTVDPGR